jgi:hypothetical protein
MLEPVVLGPEKRLITATLPTPLGDSHELAGVPTLFESVEANATVSPLNLTRSA